MTSKKFKIIYDDETKSHLKIIDKKYWGLIKEKIEEQLFYQPNVKTKNRKPLVTPPTDNLWEIRFGPKNCFRVFYKVFEEKNEVWVLAIGIKEKERIIIWKKEIEL